MSQLIRPRAANPRRQRLDQELDVEIGRRLRARRRERMLTLQQLADLSGLTVQQIQRSESGAARVTVVVLLRLADALRLPPLALLPELTSDEGTADFPTLAEDPAPQEGAVSAHELAIDLAQYLWRQGASRGGAR